jgi:AraC family transcriptional activator FtrA
MRQDSGSGGAPHRVTALIVGATVNPFELSCVAEVFARGDGRYRFEVVAEADGPVPSTRGFAVVPDSGGLQALERADTVVVPATEHLDHPGPAVVDALRAAHRRGARLVSICSGAFPLGYAGVLDGLPATTHWWYTDELARRFPGARVQPDVLYVDAGDVLTSAGSAAGLDLCLHLVRRDHGAAYANTIARALVTAPHRTGGQAQFIEPPSVPAAAGPGLEEVCAWALAHLDQDLRIEVLASRAAMSPRTLVRRFRAELGISPRRWVLAHRIDRARQLLEESDLPVEHVAAAVGFSSAGSLRPHFREATGLTPSEYRDRFGCAPGRRGSPSSGPSADGRLVELAAS